MVAKNGQGGSRQGASGHMKDGGSQFARDLEHVGDHQEQALRSGEGGGERAGLQCAVDSASSAAFGLHFSYQWNGAPQVWDVQRRPGIRKFAHPGGWSNRVDGDYFIEAVSHVSYCFVGVNHYFFT